jgi:ATP adenylyltransferase
MHPVGYLAMADIDRLAERSISPGEPLETPPSSSALWQKIQSQTEYALACGALQSIPTRYEFIEQDGVAFLVRSLNTLARKERATQRQKQASSLGKPVNPFLPYEEDLFVDNLSDTHLCLLNKYNVVDHHLLIVTRAFEEQETWLNPKDFFALGRCISAIDGLAFYNGGQIAGASQPHKHLQLVPMPLSPQGHPIPMEVVMADISSTDSTAEESQTHPRICQLDCFPFAHAIAPLDLRADNDLETLSETLMDAYRQVFQAIGVEAVVEGDRQSLPYNLLVTRRWMMIVPRQQEKYASISVNSLGFAGSLFVKDEEQKKILRQAGPMSVLQQVACPKA